MRAKASPDGLTGDVAVGRYVLRIGGRRGAELHEAAAAAEPRLRARATPILLRPRPIAGLLGRQRELTAILGGIDAGVPVEIGGPAGSGKTALLRHLASHPRTSAFAAGVVYLAPPQQTPLDLQQQLFEAFYDTPPLWKPTEADTRRALHDVCALVLVDDATLSPRELERVMDAAPHCAFVVATRERRLWSDVRGITLGGLPAEDAVALLERELERPLDAGERPAARSLCESLDGQPRRIQQAAALARDHRIALEDCARHVGPGALAAELTASIDGTERRLLLALSALAGVPVESHHVAGIAELTGVDAALATLVRRRLVLVRDPAGYLLADGVADRLRRTEELSPWVHRAITYFTSWAERHRRSQDALLQTAGPLVRVQGHALDVKRFGEALRLGRLTESALALGLRWGAWGEVLERSAAAARAMDDRAVEARVLHELGARAVCLGDAATARRALEQAVSLREQLGETGAARTSRDVLRFVAADPIDVVPVERHSSALDGMWGIDWLRLRQRAHAERRGARATETGAMVLALGLCAMLGGFAYLVALKGKPIQQASSSTPPVTAVAEPLPLAPPPADAAPATPASAASTAGVAGLQRASILIFTVRPGSIAARGPTQLCYAVRDALETRIDPEIGGVDAGAALTCRRVAATRTTTYELTAVGRDGVGVTQQVVVVR